MPWTASEGFLRSLRSEAHSKPHCSFILSPQHACTALHGVSSRMRRSSLPLLPSFAKCQWYGGSELLFLITLLLALQAGLRRCWQGAGLAPVVWQAQWEAWEEAGAGAHSRCKTVLGCRAQAGPQRMRRRPAGPTYWRPRRRRSWSTAMPAARQTDPVQHCLAHANSAAARTARGGSQICSSQADTTRSHSVKSAGPSRIWSGAERGQENSVPAPAHCAHGRGGRPRINHQHMAPLPVSKA